MRIVRPMHEAAQSFVVTFTHHSKGYNGNPPPTLRIATFYHYIHNQTTRDETTHDSLADGLLRATQALNNRLSSIRAVVVLSRLRISVTAFAGEEHDGDAYGGRKGRG
eukprot:scaffold87860_cov101-Cyclotella_meneghiniana.AAC.3